MLFLWMKALHLITMVAWFAGLFYLPRLFVYQADITDTRGPMYALFSTMSRRLYYGIMTPALIMMLTFGLGILHARGMSAYAAAGWLHAKLLCVALLIGFHIYCGICLRRFRDKENAHSARFYRIFNETPAVFLILIVLLAVLKPF